MSKAQGCQLACLLAENLDVVLKMPNTPAEIQSQTLTLCGFYVEVPNLGSPVLILREANNLKEVNVQCHYSKFIKINNI